MAAGLPSVVIDVPASVLMEQIRMEKTSAESNGDPPADCRRRIGGLESWRRSRAVRRRRRSRFRCGRKSSGNGHGGRKRGSGSGRFDEGESTRRTISRGQADARSISCRRRSKRLQTVAHAARVAAEKDRRCWSRMKSIAGEKNGLFHFGSLPLASWSMPFLGVHQHRLHNGTFLLAANRGHFYWLTTSRRSSRLKAVNQRVNMGRALLGRA